MGKKRKRSLIATFAVLFLLLAAVVLFFALQIHRRIPDLLFQYVDERQHDSRPLKLTDAGEWETLEEGLELREISFRRAGRILSGFKLIALRIDPQHLNLRMIHIPADKLAAVDMETLAGQTGALALMNTSYFEPEYKVMGLLIVNGEQLSPLRKGGSLHHGVWLLREKHAFLLHRTNIDLQGVEQAFQAGPWLVTDGEIQHRASKTALVTRRSAIAVDKRGRVLMMATDTLLGGFSLAELSQWLARPEDEGGLDAWRAINCDGGTSTQLLLNHPREHRVIRSNTHVPVYLGVFRPANI